ncbi:MAG: hypothetical protein ACREMY_31025, partial [bacterium]
MSWLRNLFSHLKLSPRAWRWIIFLACGVVGAGVVAMAALYLAVVSFQPDLPMGADLYALNRPQAFTFLDAKGMFVGQRGAIVGERLKLTELPPYVPAAFLAME